MKAEQASIIGCINEAMDNLKGNSYRQGQLAERLKKRQDLAYNIEKELDKLEDKETELEMRLIKLWEDLKNVNKGAK